MAWVRGLDRRGALAGVGVMVLLGAGIVLGSGNLRNYDPVLLTYTFGVVFSAFAVAYRTAVWLQRPPTALYARRGLELLRRGNPVRNLLFAARAAAENLAAHRFIRKRSTLRWLTHFLIAWGTLLASAVTFPLVFGWLHFETLPDAPHVYVVKLFGVGVTRFDTASPVRYVMFNLLNLSAVMVTAGVGLALHRRLRDGAALSRQQFGNDIVPLLLLLAISLTGLMLTFSAHALQGAGYQPLSLVHAIVVSGTLLYVPFGKLFHVVQRPLHVGVLLYKREGLAGPRAACRRCGEAFASAMHRDDLATVLRASGVPVPLDLCPRCKRASLGLAQARAVAASKGPSSSSSSSCLRAFVANPGEDARG